MSKQKFIVPISYSVKTYTIVEADSETDAYNKVNKYLDYSDDDFQFFDDEYDNWQVVKNEIRKIN